MKEKKLQATLNAKKDWKIKFDNKQHYCLKRNAVEHYGKSHQDMKNNRINNITNLSSPERYDYFIRKVSDFEEVWGLKDKEGWALMGSEEQVLFPIWSEKEFAELCKWDNYQPTPIPLDDFMEKLLPKLEKDSVMLAVFPLTQGKGIIRKVQEVKSDIEQECEQYE